MRGKNSLCSCPSAVIGNPLRNALTYPAGLLRNLRNIPQRISAASPLLISFYGNEERSSVQENPSLLQVLFRFVPFCSPHTQTTPHLASLLQYPSPLPFPPPQHAATPCTPPSPLAGSVAAEGACSIVGVYPTAISGRGER